MVKNKHVKPNEPLSRKGEYMKTISALDATNRFWASSELVVLDEREALDTADLDRIKKSALWTGSVFSFGRENSSKSLAKRAVHGIGAIDSAIILEVFDYNA
jgi:hypothetical protein